MKKVKSFITFLLLALVSGGCNKKVEGINPGLKEFVNNYNNNINHHYDVKSVRLGLSTLSKNYGPDKIEISVVKNLTYRGENHYNLPLRVYSNNQNVAMPVLIFFHGGGLTAGSLDDYDTIMRKIAAQNNVVVVGVEYRLAPENPYPKAFDDGLTIVNNITDVLKDEGIMHSSTVIIMGDSGGGGICAGIIARMAQGKVKTPIKGMILAYPSVDYTLHQKSYKKYGKGYVLETKKIEWYMDNVFPKGINRHNISPLFMELPTKDMLPKTLVLAAQLDPLVDEGAFYSHKLKVAGAELTYKQMPGLIHAFLNLEKLTPNELSDVYKTINTFIKSLNT